MTTVAEPLSAFWIIILLLDRSFLIALSSSGERFGGWCVIFNSLISLLIEDMLAKISGGILLLEGVQLDFSVKGCWGLLGRPLQSKWCINFNFLPKSVAAFRKGEWVTFTGVGTKRSPLCKRDASDFESL